MMSFQIDNSIVIELRELAQATARKHKTVLSMGNEELDYIHRNVRISIVGASTRIENAVLTDAEVDWLDTKLTEDARTTAYLDHRDFIKDKLSKNKERSIDEVAGSFFLISYILADSFYLNPSSRLWAARAQYSHTQF